MLLPNGAAAGQIGTARRRISPQRVTHAAQRYYSTRKAKHGAFHEQSKRTRRSTRCTLMSVLLSGFLLLAGKVARPSRSVTPARWLDTPTRCRCAPRGGMHLTWACLPIVLHTTPPPGPYKLRSPLIRANISQLSCCDACTIKHPRGRIRHRIFSQQRGECKRRAVLMENTWTRYF